MNIPEGYGEAVYTFAKDGDPEPMISAWGVLTLGDPPTVEDANDLFEAWSTGGIKVSTTAVTTLTSVTLRIAVGADNAMLDAVSDHAPVAGSSGALCAPSNCAQLIKKSTSSAGRKGKGRLFYPDVQAETVDHNGFLLLDSLPGYIENAQDWLTAINAVPVITNVVVLHTSPADVPSTVTGVTVDGRIATQRRRMRP